MRKCAKQARMQFEKSKNNSRGGGAYRCIDRFLALDSVSRVSARIVYRENHGLARGVSQGVGPGTHREKCVSSR